MTFHFVPLDQIPCRNYVALHTHPRVCRHLPLANNGFNERDCAAWLASKAKHWRDYGYGPHAIVIDDQFAGWGGFQNESGEPDLAIILDPKFWGWGEQLCKRMIKDAQTQYGFEAITVHLPESRKSLRSLLRMGFIAEGSVNLDQERFIRFRLILTNNSLSLP